MTSRECADRENGIGLCTRGLLRPDICLGRTLWMAVCLYAVVARPSACVEAKVPETWARRKNRPPPFPFAVHLSRPCLDERMQGVGR